MWNRSDVPYCVCPSLTYKHAHCPCEKCRGKAVSRATEFRHWCAVKREAEISTSTLTGTSGDLDLGTEPDPSPTPTCTSSNVQGENPADMDANDDDDNTCTTAGLHAARVVAVDPESDPQSSVSSSVQTVSGTNTLIGNILSCVVEGIELMENVDGSQEDFLNIMRFGQRMYNRGHGSRSESDSNWPNNWQDAMRMLREAGYKDPTTYYVCLSESHYCNWDLMESVSEMCKICGAKGTIPYYYLSIQEKVRRWCSDAEFCVKMTAHWGEKDHWLNHTGGWMPRKEIWDGYRYTSCYPLHLFPWTEFITRGQEPVLPTLRPESNILCRHNFGTFW